MRKFAPWNQGHTFPTSLFLNAFDVLYLETLAVSDLECHTAALSVKEVVHPCTNMQKAFHDQNEMLSS